MNIVYEKEICQKSSWKAIASTSYLLNEVVRICSVSSRTDSVVKSNYNRGNNGFTSRITKEKK